MQKTAAAISLIALTLFAAPAPFSRMAAAGRAPDSSRGPVQFGKLGNAVKLGTKVATRPKFTDEDEAVLHRFVDVLLAGCPDPAPGSSPEICLILT